MFFLYDSILTRTLTIKMNIAAKQGYTPDVVSDSNTISDSYWRHEQDILPISCARCSDYAAKVHPVTRFTVIRIASYSQMWTIQ